MSDLLATLGGLAGGLVGGLLGANANPYVPVEVDCPAGELVRSASSGLSSQEAAWVATRYDKATHNLQTWLDSTGAAFGPVGRYPQLAIAYSGGGTRAQLCGAGVRQALDDRESNLPVAGLLQAMTYEAGLSGGAWMLGSVAGNNYPTISYLRDNVWGPNDAYGLLAPDRLGLVVADLGIVDDVASKLSAGYPITIVDVWARMLSWNYLTGPRGGVERLWSDVAGYSNFTSFENPFPILTALGTVDEVVGCQANTNSTQFEMTPYDFGSWDDGLEAFVQTKYVGTKMTAGKPRNDKCVTRYDNTGFITGTSSDIFAALVCGFLDVADVNFPQAHGLLEGLLDIVHDIRHITDLAYASTYPNPFFQYPGVEHGYAETQLLNLVDGGTGQQNDPVWPFLNRPDVDVVFVSDNSNDDGGDYPDGLSLHQTYMSAKAANLTRMPTVPSVQNMGKVDGSGLPRFFGCHEPDTLTIVYLPNKQWTFDSGTLTYKLRYTQQETNGMISNGNQVANFGSTRADWAVCLGCAIMSKSQGTLPAECDTCFADLCVT